MSNYFLFTLLTLISGSQLDISNAPDSYWVYQSNQYNSSLPYLQDSRCSATRDDKIDSNNDSSQRNSMLLNCSQPSALFDGSIGRYIPNLPETSDLLKHYTWQKSITPNPFVAMKYIQPLVELTNITLYLYKEERLNIHLPVISVCTSTSQNFSQCDDVEISPRHQFNDGVVAWPVTLLTPARSVTFLNISFQYELETVHQWIFLSEVRVRQRQAPQITITPTGYGIAGRPLVLRCSFPPTNQTVNITWIFTNTNSEENTVTLAEYTTLTPSNGYGEFTIPNFQSRHSGNYRCLILVLNGDIVLEEISSIERTVKIAVPPTLSHPPQNVTTYTNSLAFFQCGISNETFPPANVEWFKGSEVLNIDDDNLFVSPNNNTLIIHSSTSADEGEYHCQALNDVGSVTSDDVTLTVIDQSSGDDPPGVVTNISVQPVSQTQVRVKWYPPKLLIFYPHSLQYRIYWDDVEDGASLSVENARQFSELLPSSQTDYLVKDLNQAYKLSIIIVAYFYTEKGKASQSVRGRTYGNVPVELPGSVSVTRSNNNRTIEVRWNTIVPNRGQGEGDVYRYDIRYYKCGEQDNAIIIDGDHPPAMSDQQMKTIPNVDPDTEYSVQVRVIVLIQSEPDVRFGVGRWSGDVCKDSTAPMEDNDTAAGYLTFILGSLAALFVIGFTVTVICITVLLRWRKRRLTLKCNNIRTHSENMNTSVTLSVSISTNVDINHSNGVQDVEMTVNPSYGVIEQLI
ncbi:uncharacterized protein [Dysidea avara]|uniref:uncharacterized protein isoform X2 n=1 Tax=Dysidea avara TaxID=196820 RepID=UPI003330A3BC